MDQEWNQVLAMVEQVELARNVSDFVVKPSLKIERAPSGKSAGSTAPPNLTKHPNHTGSVRSALCERPFKVATKSYHCQSESKKSVKHNYETRVKDKSRNETKDYDSETEKSRAQELGFGNNYSTLCSRALKLNTQSFYQSNSFVKCADHVNVNHNSGMETKSLMHENNQRNHKVESNSTRGTSRSETCNCPSCTSCSRAFKHTTQSYSYSNSSEDESERIERKEREI